MSDKEPVSLNLHGKAWVFGDDVPTDQIVATRYLFSPMSEAVQHVLENLNPAFPTEVAKGDIVVAGKHFGQSSGRARAPKTLQATGVGGVIAESYARTWLRNCFEIGLPILECPGISEAVKDGDVVRADLIDGRVINETTGVELKANPVQPFLLNMLRSGGLIALVKQKGADWGRFDRQDAF